jgi:hypothetical protein
MTSLRVIQTVGQERQACECEIRQVSSRGRSLRPRAPRESRFRLRAAAASTLPVVRKLIDKDVDSLCPGIHDRKRFTTVLERVGLLICQKHSHEFSLLSPSPFRQGVSEAVYASIALRASTPIRDDRQSVTLQTDPTSATDAKQHRISELKFPDCFGGDDRSQHYTLSSDGLGIRCRSSSVRSQGLKTTEFSPATESPRPAGNC